MLSPTKKYFYLFILAIFFNLAFFNFTKAANTCTQNNYNLSPVLLNSVYNSNAKNFITNSDLINSQKFSATLSGSTITFTVNHPTAKIFWIQYSKDDKSAYIQYNTTATITEKVNNKIIQNINVDIGSSPTTTLSKQISLDNQNHEYTLAINYSPAGPYCETNTIDFSGEPGKYISKDTITKTSQTTINLSSSNQSCNNIKAQIESQICQVVSCLKNVYNNDSYWTNTKPNTFQILMDGTWTANDLTADGQTALKTCDRQKETLDNLANKYSSSGCSETINWKGNCHFNENSSDTALDPNGDSSTANTLSWLQNKLGKVATMISEIPTSVTTSTCISTLGCENGRNTIEKYVCTAVCWVSDGTYGLLLSAFEIFKGANSLNSTNPYTPNIQSVIQNGSSSSSNSSTGTTPTATNGSNSNTNAAANAATNSTGTNTNTNAASGAGNSASEQSGVQIEAE